jgi:hypothetical protein
MYDIKKQRSTGARIVFGIVIFAFISLVLRLALEKPTTTLNEDLIQAANEINARAPIILDSTTRFDRIDVLLGDIFQYNYTLTAYKLEEVDTNYIKNTWRKSMIENTKKNPQAKVFRDNGVVIQAKYTDKEGNYVTTVSINPTEY